MEPPTQTDVKRVGYQVPRNIYIRIWWWRMMLRPRRLIFIIFIIAFSIVCLFLGQGMEYVGGVLLGFVMVMPIALYRVLAKAIDNDRRWTDPKELEFGTSQLAMIGPNWKTETPWTMFKGFSEDANYFYLHLSNNGLVSIIPKSAFSVEQQQIFRQYAQMRKV